jgi:S1-C subfamily serine protease
MICRNASDLYKALDRCQIGEEVDLELLRDNDKMHIKVKLGSSS